MDLLRSGTIAFVAILASLSGSLAAQQLEPTPRLSAGSNYSAQPPEESDSDLRTLRGRNGQALGQPVTLSGRVLHQDGSPYKDLFVEIWQSDANGFFVDESKREDKTQRFDRNFQGYGKTQTNAQGQYSFQTIAPVPSTGRSAPHIFVRVRQGDLELLTTQIFIRDHPGNKDDQVFKGIRDVLKRELVQVEFAGGKDKKDGLTAEFDIVIGAAALDASRRTPQESPEP